MAGKDLVLIGIFALIILIVNSFFILAMDDNSSAKSQRLNTIRLLNVEIEDDEEDESDEEISNAELETIDGLISEARAKEIAIERIGGYVIGFESERENGIVLYEVELRSDGERVEVEIDARTGDIIEIEYGDDN